MNNEDEYYSIEKLKSMGVTSCGANVNISRKSSIYSGGGGITIGEHVRIDDFCVIVGNVNIGNNVHIASHCGLHASGLGKIVFEDYSGISSNVQLYASSDDYDGEYLTWRPGIDKELFHSEHTEIRLGKYSQIGTGSVVLPGGCLAEGTAVGAMSLVRSELLPWSIYAGIPCKRLRERKNHFLTNLNLYKKSICIGNEESVK